MKLVQTRKVEVSFYLDYEGQYVSLEIFGTDSGVKEVERDPL